MINKEQKRKDYKKQKVPTIYETTEAEKTCDLSPTRPAASLSPTRPSPITTTPPNFHLWSRSPPPKHPPPTNHTT